MKPVILVCAALLTVCAASSRAEAQSATPPPVAPAQEVQAAQEAEADKSTGGFDGRVMLVGSLRSMPGTRSIAGGVHGAAGVAFKSFAVHGELGYEHGRTERGLATNRLRTGGSAEAILGRIRLGAGLDILHMSFMRASYRDSVGTLALGLGLFGTVDLVQLDESALVLGVRGDVDLTSGVQTGGVVMLGLRF